MSAVVFGLVLVGGRSTRMRTPKCDLVYHDDPQWRVAHAVLARRCENVFLSRRKDQTFPEDVSTFVDEKTDEGPASGLRTAHRRYPEVAWLVLACDLPGGDDSALEFLLSRRRPEKDATVFGTRENPEPLFGIWEPRLLARFWENSPSRALQAADVEWLGTPRAEWLANVNTPEERSRFQVRARPA